MSKIAFLFVGQGAQYIGMGEDLYNEFDVCKKVYDEASNSLDIDLKDLCFHGEENELNKTENTQPALVTTSLAAYEALLQYDVKADIMAGLSLGEYTALAASGVFSINQVIPLVKKRGRYMQEAVPEGLGKMVAILGLSTDGVEKVCEEASELGVVEVANYNCPGQIVIGGHNEAVDYAMKLAIEKGAKRTVELPVSAPFHTSLLEAAAKKLMVDLAEIELEEINTPIIGNLTADYIPGSASVRKNLYEQVMNSVLWEQSIRKMIEDGVEDFIEIGPGRSLSSFVRQINRTVRTYNVQDLKSLETTVSKLNNLN